MIERLIVLFICCAGIVAEAYTALWLLDKAVRWSFGL